VDSNYSARSYAPSRVGDWWVPICCSKGRTYVGSAMYDLTHNDLKDLRLSRSFSPTLHSYLQLCAHELFVHTKSLRFFVILRDRDLNSYEKCQIERDTATCLVFNLPQRPTIWRSLWLVLLVLLNRTPLLVAGISMSTIRTSIHDITGLLLSQYGDCQGHFRGSCVQA
jgi:hypothetical protein